jgi:succinate dehydrogenase / fumarate reductase cytochrome b subunit
VNLITAFFGSSIGKKWIVAATGLMLVGYVVGHMVGNLQIFAGPEKINRYAAFLHSMPGTLWMVRIILLAALLLHIVITLQLAVENRGARAEGYARRNRVQATLAARTMAWSGLIVLAFVLYHLAHFTVRITDPRFHALPRGEFDVYSMIILGFQHPLVSGFYILGVFLLCLHLSHGLESMLQSLGANSRAVRGPIVRAGQILAVLIFLGYISIPVAVLARFLKV